MAAPRFARRQDGNHNALVKVFIRLGCTVHDMTRTGIDGFPDLLVGCMGVWHLVEAKNPDNWYGKQGLADTQTAFQLGSQGEPVWLINSEDGVIALVQQWRKP